MMIVKIMVLCVMVACRLIDRYQHMYEKGLNVILAFPKILLGNSRLLSSPFWTVLLRNAAFKVTLFPTCL
jgi:hypothetical protein